MSSHTSNAIYDLGPEGRLNARLGLALCGGVSIDHNDEVTELRFGCTACGKCCNTPPQMDIVEALDMSRHFIIAAELRGTDIPNLDRPEGADLLSKIYPEIDIEQHPERAALLRDRMQVRADKMGLEVTDPGTDSVRSHIQVGFIDIERKKTCPQLGDDGLCRVHNERPSKCRLVPFEEICPDSLAGEAAVTSLALMLAGGAECQIDAAAPLVWTRDDGFVDEGARDARDRFMGSGLPGLDAVILEVTDELIECKVREAGVSRAAMEAIILDLCRKGERPVLPLVPVLHRLIKIGAVSISRAVSVLDDQVDLIDARLDAIDPRDQIYRIADFTVREELETWRSSYAYIREAWRPLAT